eukprot:XP_011676841.1 PREDICTED: galanin receptor type 1-like [Strongylocentrotus purpuratus]
MSNASHHSSFDGEGQDQQSDDVTNTILTTIHIIFAILGIVGNGLVLVVIAFIKDLQDVTNLYIANQSLIDFMTSLFLLFGYVIPVPALPEDRPTLSRFLCAFWYTKYPFWSTIVASCLNLAVITFERYVAVAFPIHYRINTISRKAIAVTFIPWIAGFLFQISLLCFSKVEDGLCLEFLWPDEATKKGICLATYFLEFLIPVTSMVYVYARILRELRRSGKQISQPSNTSSAPAGTEPKVLGRIAADYRTKARKNIIKTLATVSICFVICMSLNQHIYLAYGFGFDLDFGGPMYITSVVMAFGNIWINPLIYTFQYERFQKGIKKLFCRPHITAQHLHVKVISNQSGRI